MTPPDKPLFDQAARDRIARDLDTTLVVEAAAGTGKTSTLISRMLGVLESGRGRLDGMVAVTFTEAAAGELKLRLRTAVEKRRQETRDEAVLARLELALEHLEVARIGTIHAFCADLLRERPVEAEVDPRFEVATEDVSQVLIAQAFDRWFEETLAAPGEGVRRVLRRTYKDGPRRALLEAVKKLVERRDFPTPWTASPMQREQAIDDLLGEMRALAARLSAYPGYDGFGQSLQEIAGLVHDVERREEITPERDYDGLESTFVNLVGYDGFKHWGKTGRMPAGKSDEAQAKLREKKADIARRDALEARLRDFRRDADAELAPLLQAELWPVVARYEALKERGRYLDFLDLLLLARALVVRKGEVRREFQQRFSHIFVDEFQDTDPVQAELLLLLAADDPAETDWTRVTPIAGKLFVVGDPKQSIYRFRRADVSLYSGIVQRLVARGAERLHLSVSFRSAPEIQSAVNAAFAQCMDGSRPSQAAYVPLQPHRPSVDGQPAVVFLPAHSAVGARGDVTKTAVKASLPETVAGFVEWMVTRSGWTVDGGGGARVPLRPQHVCLLFKRFRDFGDDVTRPYVRALEARSVPHILVGGSALHSREEVQALRSALAAIERPDDELSVYATLRGPFLAVDDAALLAWKQRFRTLHPFRRVPDDLAPALAHVAEALAVLRDLHVRRNRRPIAATIGLLLQATRAHAGLAIWPSGEQALANCNRIIDLARRAEKTGLTSFRAFVDALEQEAESGEAGEAPIVEEGTEGVRLMTVHRAKGLEFPIVLLVDAGAPLARREADRWVDSGAALCAMPLAGCSPRELVERGDDEAECQREEAHRVLYVAATRARDLLVVTGAAEGRVDGWLAPLHPALYPPPEKMLRPLSVTPPGCDDFRPDEYGPDRSGVQPGLHAPEIGGHTVVWWDPCRLRLVVKEKLGLRQHRLLESDEKAVASTAGVEAHAAWQAERARVREEGARPALRIVTPTEAAENGRSAPCEVPLRVERVAEGFGRPHGKRFGVLVHAVLAAVDLAADEPAVAATAQVQGRILGASDDEVAAAATVVSKALATPLMRQAAAAGQCQRELPVTMLDADGTLIEGVLDLAFHGEDSWTVVDFKTDVDLSGRLEAYRVQTAYYAEALRQASGRAVAEVVLLAV